MMDCSKKEVFMKEWERLCQSVNDVYCVGCVINKRRKGYSCRKWVQYNHEEAVKIVQEWSDANPIKTRLSVLKEQYPNLKTYDGRVVFCAGELYGFSCGKRTSCDDCWNEPIEDGEGNG